MEGKVREGREGTPPPGKILATGLLDQQNLPANISLFCSFVAQFDLECLPCSRAAVKIPVF